MRLVEQSVRQHKKILTSPLTGPDFSLVMGKKSLFCTVHTLTFVPVDLMPLLNTVGEEVNSLQNLQQK
jgi:hypothetical protein